MKQGISIIICTHNGAKLLPDTLRHIARMRVDPEIPWEVLVINNASTDNTYEVTVTEWKNSECPASFRLLNQPEKGLAYARDMGIKYALYDFILFCDDDNWLSSDYVNIAYNLMIKNPFIGALGGYGELVFENPAPSWAAMQSALASGPQATSSGKVKHNAVYGAGCIIRRTVLDKLIEAGFKPLLTDRRGKTLSAGGDYEICYAISLAGYEVWYDERLRFKHYMPKSRITPDYCIRLYKEGARSLNVLIPYRLRLNKNCKNLASFNIKFASTYLFYARRLLRVLGKRIRLKMDPEEALQNKLEGLSYYYKLKTCKDYLTMIENFKKIMLLESTLSHCIEVK